MITPEKKPSPIQRRTFVKAAVAATTLAGTSVADNASRSTSRSQYDIAPIRSWNARTETHTAFFPIGWYSFGPWAQIKEIAANGANTVLYAGMGIDDWQMNDALTQMNLAGEHGVKVVVGLDGKVVGPVRFGDQSTYGAIPEYVEVFNNHTAMLGWQLGDEFSVGAAHCVGETVKLLRHLGSKHQTWQVHPHTWSNDDVKALMAKTDVCTFDGYTYLDGQSEFDPTASARVLAWQQAKADLIQDHGWAGNVNITQAVGCKCGDAPFRFPTAREYRWNVFSAIASTGARGTLNWIYSYFGGFYADDPERFFEFRDNVVKPVNLEQAKLARALERGYNVGRLSTNLDQLTDTTIPPATGPYRKFNKVGRILLHDVAERKYYLIVTNNEPDTLNLQLTMSELPARLKSLAVSEPHTKRRLLLKRSRPGNFELRDSLAGYSVSIYEFG